MRKIDAFIWSIVLNKKTYFFVKCYLTTLIVYTQVCQLVNFQVILFIRSIANSCLKVAHPNLADPVLQNFEKKATIFKSQLLKKGSKNWAKMKTLSFWMSKLQEFFGLVSDLKFWTRDSVLGSFLNCELQKPRKLGKNRPPFLKN